MFSPAFLRFSCFKTFMPTLWISRNCYIVAGFEFNSEMMMERRLIHNSRLARVLCYTLAVWFRNWNPDKAVHDLVLRYNHNKVRLVEDRKRVKVESVVEKWGPYVNIIFVGWLQIEIKGNFCLMNLGIYTNVLANAIIQFGRAWVDQRKLMFRSIYSHHDKILLWL